jgi:hypothetical protein
MGFKDVLKGIAPVLARTFGGPFGGVAAEMLEQAFGEKVDEAKLNELLASKDPTVIVKLREIENTLKVRLRELDIEERKVDVDEERAHAGDRDSARRREAEVKDLTPKVLAYGVVGGFLALIALMFFYEPPAGTKDILIGVVNVLGTLVIMIMTYYFGSSSGSKRNGSAIAEIATKK